MGEWVSGSPPQTFKKRPHPPLTTLFSKVSEINPLTYSLGQGTIQQVVLIRVTDRDVLLV